MVGPQKMMVVPVPHCSNATVHMQLNLFDVLGQISRKFLVKRSTIIRSMQCNNTKISVKILSVGEDQSTQPV